MPPSGKPILTLAEKQLALKNALRYFQVQHHPVLAPEFAAELNQFGRIYMHRFRPVYPMHARPVRHYPCRTPQAAAIMLMIQNNLDPEVAQHPHELITYGGNGAVFQNWGAILANDAVFGKNDQQTNPCFILGHPLGLFPSHPDAPR